MVALDTRGGFPPQKSEWLSAGARRRVPPPVPPGARTHRDDRNYRAWAASAAWSLSRGIADLPERHEFAQIFIP